MRSDLWPGGGVSRPLKDVLRFPVSLLVVESAGPVVSSMLEVQFHMRHDRVIHTVRNEVIENRIVFFEDEVMPTAR